MREHLPELKRSAVDKCVWSVWKDDLKLTVGTFVDNFFIVYHGGEASTQLRNKLVDIFKAKAKENHSDLNSLGPIKNVLGCEFERTPDNREGVLHARNYTAG